jgi:dihydropteroate synthase
VLSRKTYRWLLPGGAVTLGERTLVMGAVNVTPDSFADGGLYLDPERAVAAALRMVEEGADLIDVGGESTRPGAEPVPAAEERRRILPVVEGVARRVRVPVSVDTYKAEVARAALDCGAAIVNDVSGLRYDPALASVAAEARAGLILMHNRGRSRDMYREAAYGDVARLDALRALDRPVLVGPSRKSFLREALGDVEPQDRDWGTAGAVAAAVLLGAHVVRVHAVRPMVDVVRTVDRIVAARGARAET